MKKYLPVLLLTFVNIIGFSLLIPVLPAVTEKYIPEHLVGIVYGGLVSAYALFQFLAAPVLGSLSDKYGRKPILMLSQLGTTLSWVVFATAYFAGDSKIGSVPLAIAIIAFSRVVDGITGGNISVAQAWISDVTPKQDRTKVFGLIGAVFGIGFLFGPAIGGLSSSGPIGFLGTAIVAFLISLGTLIAMQFGLPESLPEEKRDKELHIHFIREINIFYKIKPFRENSFIMRLLLVRVFIALVFASYTTIIILYLATNFSLSQVGLGVVLSFIGIYSIVNQAVLVRKLAHKFGDLKTIYLGICSTFAGLIILPLIPTTLEINIAGSAFNPGLVLVMINAYFLNLGISLVMPTFKSILTNNVADNRQGLITGIDESLLALGQGITPIIAGGLYSLFGLYTFFIFALLLLLPHLFIWLRTGHPVLQHP